MHVEAHSRPPAPRVVDYMSVSVHGVDADTPLAELEPLFELYAVSTFIVEQHERPVGVVSRTDLFRSAQPETWPPARTLAMPERCVADIMEDQILGLGAYEPLSKAARLMAEHGVHQVFAFENGKIHGVVTVRDVMRALVDARLATPLGAIMTTRIVSVQAHQTLRAAVAQLRDARTQAVLVLEAEWPVGVLRTEDVLLAREWPGDMPIEEWMSRTLLCLPVTMPAFRAAAHALAMRVSHIVVMDDEGMRGLVTGINFAAALADERERSRP